MAVDNLNYYSSWLPAWQLTDRYSSQPWCLKSKNLDIFSSSKSVKATAWSEPSAWAGDIIKQDGDLILKTDWKVYNISSWSEVLVVDPSINFPSYSVGYNWPSGTYTSATWGTPQDLVAKYEWDELKSFVVFTDRASYTWSAVKFTPKKKFGDCSSNLTVDDDSQFIYWYAITKNSTSGSTSTVKIKIENANFSTAPVKIYADQANDSDTDISIQSIEVSKERYYYDPELDAMVARFDGVLSVTVPETDIKTQQVTINVPTMPLSDSRDYWVEIQFKYTRHEWVSTYWWNGTLYIDFNNGDPSWIMSWSDWDYNEYYSYLPARDRNLIPVGEYYWMKWVSFQTLYTWDWSWVTNDNTTRQRKSRYDFVQYMWWISDVSMDVISMIVRNESIYMIGNMNWNWYIIPCDLTWQRGTPFIAYWCTFRWATNIDYLLYLVWEDRWISQLWVYNGQELVPLLWWNQEVWEKDLIWVAEQYNFDWNMVEYRGNLVLTTSDGRIFEYWQTYWGKGWAFIHDLGANLHDSLTIDSLKAKGNDLKVDFSVTDTIEWTTATTKWSTTYQDDVPIKHYNSAWEAVYPIVLGNHLLEKEESDLYASYILPSQYCKLEFWGMANHYHFWTFTSDDNVTLSTSTNYKIETCSWNYHLQFIERNGSQYTFKLVWNLPKQLPLDEVIIDPIEPWIMGYITNGWVRELGFTTFNHFRKIWQITTTEYVEWEFRFTNLNNKLELPKSHSLQIMVKGYWDSDHTPELFSLDLVANQRDRW